MTSIRAPRPAVTTSKPKVASAPAPRKEVATSTRWAAKATTIKTTKAQAVSASASAKVGGPGPVGELEKQGAVVVSNSDGFAPTMQLHEQLAKHLPSSAKLVVLRNKDLGDWGGPPPAGAKVLDTTVDSPWARDFAPTFVRNKQGKLEIVEFKYAYEGADSVAKSLGKKLGIPVVSSKLSLEGGNLLADKGRLFITTRVLEKNPGMTKAQVEEELQRTLHVDHVEWMQPLPNEATGHVDMYAKQVGPNTMLISDTINPDQKKVMDAAARKFESLGYTVIRTENADLKPKAGQPWGNPNSYANALVVNGTAFVPQYARPNELTTSRGRQISNFDRQALSAYASAGLKVVGVPAFDLIQYQGSVHCMTNAMPAEVDLAKLK